MRVALAGVLVPDEVVLHADAVSATDTAVSRRPAWRAVVYDRM
ncbi:hypothetical protein O1M63_04530 [Streptomyces mirabilis]|nr:hypothetical protein [Streptomyces mirabilis]